MERFAKPPRVISDEDRQLFKEAVRGVTPLRPDSRAAFSPPPPRPVPRMRLRDQREVLEESLADLLAWEDDFKSGDELSFTRPGVPPTVLRKLARGHWVVNAQIDLHGLTRAEARVVLAEFLRQQYRRGARCLRIIHGKGLGSRNREPVLRNKVRNWLMQRDEVLAFRQARELDGGTGAVIVLLKAG